jgi:hypothetical protein
MPLAKQDFLVQHDMPDWTPVERVLEGGETQVRTRPTCTTRRVLIVYGFGNALVYNGFPLSRQARDGLGTTKQL